MYNIYHNLQKYISFCFHCNYSIFDLPTYLYYVFFFCTNKVTFIYMCMQFFFYYINGFLFHYTMGMSAIMYTMRQYIYVILQVCYYNLVNFNVVEMKI